MARRSEPVAPDLARLGLAREEREALADRFVQDVGALCADLLPAARHLLGRIDGVNWTLEWSLAHWLGEAWGADTALQRRLGLANLFMLGYQRLADDLADGDANAGELPLAVALHHLWHRQYTELFAADPDRSRAFWPGFEADLARWVAQTLACRSGPPANLGATDDAALAAYASRAAPLRTSAAAVALATGRADAVAGVRDVLEDVLVAVVLLDDTFDWVEDLAAGRHNAFVACCSPLAQVPGNRGLNRLAVMKDVYLGKAGGACFDAMRRRLARAGTQAAALGCGRLGDFVAWFVAEVDACEGWLAQQAADGRQRFEGELAAACGRAGLDERNRPCMSPGA